MPQQDLPYTRQYLQCCTSDVDLLQRSELPSRWKEVRCGWENTIINNSRQTGSVVSTDGLSISRRYPTESGIIFANHPLPLRCDVYYFEVKVCEIKELAPDGVKDIYLGFLPSLCVPTSPREMCCFTDLKVGDVLGCGISYLQSTIFTMRNGDLENQINSLPISWTLFPAMNLDYGIRVTTNFGQSKFCVDVDSILYSVQVDVERTPWRAVAAMLPNELHIEILRHVDTLNHNEHTSRKRSTSQRDSETLKACAAVCTTWYNVFRPFTLTAIRVQCSEAARQLSAMPSFPTHIRHLTLESRLDTKHPWAHVLFVSSAAAKMTSLKELCWDPTGCGAAIGNDVFIGCHPRVKTMLPAVLRRFVDTGILRLRGHTFSSFLDIARLVTALPQLRELYLTEVCWNSPEAVDSPPRWLRRPRTLRSISIKHGLRKNHLYVRGIELVVALWLFVVPPRRLGPSQAIPKNCLVLDEGDARLILTLTQRLLELVETRLTEAKAWHPYLELTPNEDAMDAWLLRVHPRWILQGFEYNFTLRSDEKASSRAHVLASVTLPDQLLFAKNLSSYEEIAHPFLRMLNGLLPRLSNWSSIKTCVVELRTYSLGTDMNIALDDIAMRVPEAMPDIYSSRKLRILKFCHGNERWRQDMRLCIRLVGRV